MNKEIIRILGKLSYEEQWTLINHIMQAKADMDVKEKRSEEAYTPTYQINEYLLSQGIIKH